MYPPIPKLYIPVGIPGCGKSTFYDVLNHDKLCLCSTDHIRQEMSNVNDQTRNDEVFEIYHKRISTALRNRYSAYADATNLRDYARAKLREIADQTDAETHLILFTNIAQAFERNAARERVVPDDVMVRMLGQYSRACVDIPTETYTSITYIH